MGRKNTLRATSAASPKSVLDRINAVVTILKRLASDVEIIREGLGALKTSLPQKYDTQHCLLHEQASALERISIGLGMVQHTAASLEEVRSHAETVIQEVETLVLVKNGLDIVLASCDLPDDWQPAMLEKATYRFNQCIARIREAAACLTEETAQSENSEQRGSL